MFGFLSWDPKPTVFDFVLPLINRPLMWYGILFALGFVIGYYIFRYCWLRCQLFSLRFYTSDICCWSLFLQRKHTSKYLLMLFKTFSPEVQKFCQEQNYKQSIPKRIKDEVIQSINYTVDHPIDLPSSHKKQSHLMRFIRAHMNAFQIKRVQSFLQIDAHLQPWILPFTKRHSIVMEKLVTYLIVGMLIGAKLGDFIFYQDWRITLQNFWTVFAFWEAGLASHGAALGILCALWLFCRKNHLSVLHVLDLVVIPAPLVGSFIRLGNFINQEILGTSTNVPWGVVFLHPVGSNIIVPRHPVQLYEACSYIVITVFLFLLWRKEPSLVHRGRITGWFFVSVFSARFFLEFFKEEQSVYLLHSQIKMGQVLSIPFIVFGIWLLYRSHKKFFHKA